MLDKALRRDVRVPHDPVASLLIVSVCVNASFSFGFRFVPHEKQYFSSRFGSAPQSQNADTSRVGSSVAQCGHRFPRNAQFFPHDGQKRIVRFGGLGPMCSQCPSFQNRHDIFRAIQQRGECRARCSERAGPAKSPSRISSAPCRGQS